VKDVAAGTTFGGHPAACAAATATIDLLLREQIVPRSAVLGRRALARAKEWERYDPVAEVRGLGLCLGIELHDRHDDPDPDAARRVFFDCVRHGAIPLWNHGDHVIRVQPPLTIRGSELDRSLDILEAAIRRAARAS
jgi:4-aminobutyrate aminotransferase-like enzyme